MSDARTIAGLALSRTPLFAGLTPAQLFEVEAAMRPRAFDARSELCRAGEVGDALFVILDGLAHVLVTDPRTGALETIARLRRGDVVGEMSLITGEPRVATVVAGLPTKVLELDREGFSAVIARHPPILGNLTRILSQRLAAAGTFEIESRRRGEAVALLVGPALEAVVPRVVAAAQAAAPREVAALDTRDSLQRALAQLDELLPAHHAVILVADLAGAGVALLADHVDRVVALVDDREADVLEALRRSSGAKLRHLELVLAVEGPGGPGGLVDRSAAARIATRKADGGPDALATGDVAWLSRHLTRTKLGLALGAGGAKGYAHIGALHVLEQAGYTVDAVGGSSIGAIVGSWVALGRSAAEIEAAMREAFTPENVAAMFKLSLTGMSTGLDTMTSVLRASTGERTFDDLVIPLVVMSVDLTERKTAPITDGPLWEALLAATALAGIFPPYQRNGQRLVDGLALVPVPTEEVAAAGADVTVAVNIMPRETLPAWPGEQPPEPPPAKGGSRMLDTLLEVMDLAQLDASVRHAALADVVVTPRFGPASWRDFHLADLFLAAGRAATEEQLARLRSLARPAAG